MAFSKLGLSPVVCSPLARLGYAEPTPVQRDSIPVVLRGADLLARAQTGTGKTAAFGLPMIDRLLAKPQARTGGSRPRALVLVPTRELAVQVHRALAGYAASARLSVVSIFGGVGMAPQIKALRGAHIVVATPGRLIDHLDRRTIDLSAVEILVLDEADRMLDMGFLPPLRRLLAALPRSRQTLLFSATLADDVARLARDFTVDAVRVDVAGGEAVAPTIAHRIHPVVADRKRALLLHVLTDASPRTQALVFCKTKRGADRVGEHLSRAGMRAAVIHGNKTQGARARSLADFKGGRVGVLVATDIAARGLDIPELPLVVNFDLPMVAEDYIHRIGRTGRAGAAGRAVSLVTAEDRELLGAIQRLLPVPLERVPVAGFEAGFDVSPAPKAPRGGAERRHRPFSGRRPSRFRRSSGRPTGASSRNPHAYRDRD